VRAWRFVLCPRGCQVCNGLPYALSLGIERIWGGPKAELGRNVAGRGVSTPTNGTGEVSPVVARSCPIQASPGNGRNSMMKGWVEAAEEDSNSLFNERPPSDNHAQS